MSEKRESSTADGSDHKRDPAEVRDEDAYNHLVDLYYDILGEEPAPDATAAEIAATIRRAFEAPEHDGRIN